ncbi:AAA family ATPase [Leucobacter sp. CSA1]|uniref:AAA family ATPase n=1 Tax=Leucobacter chromiisoli TaxID=2796471 RepID=A0A934QBX7_9MICO|nr:AAA family ATPase [Leucobacter chromiisoli]MBK0420247.1 AAA family ATPase [Leucobacter chromiisoli]
MRREQTGRARADAGASVRRVSAEDAARVSALAGRIVDEVASAVVGKPAEIEAAVATLLAGGHLLIEDVPGVGKTTLASALARTFGADSVRIQFTSDMLPTDVTGVSVFDQVTREFRFHRGPIFANLVVADEVNRSTPKTQSALIEAMGEAHVTVDGTTYPLPDPFMVVATQNPQDMEGTFPLPEAQRDRFMARISLGYPSLEAEVALLESRSSADPLAGVRTVVPLGEVVAARAAVSAVHLATEVSSYLVSIVSSTRAHRGIVHGASPRASLHLAQMARARAAMAGRAYVSPDDVAALATIVLSHRLVARDLHASAVDALAAAARAVDEIVARTPVPGLR